MIYLYNFYAYTYFYANREHSLQATFAPNQTTASRMKQRNKTFKR